jgi:GTPase SAR1 family protein
MATFKDLVDVHRKYLHLDDNQIKIMKILYATILANIRIDDIPIWILLIGNPGSGKTTMVNSFSASQAVYTISTLTPASILSAYKDGGESILEKCKNKVLVIKDFSTITELNADMRNYLFSMLRDAYDGEIRRATGKGSMEFKGKFGIIGCATFSIEAFKKMEGLLGERFIHIKMFRNNTDEVLKMARMTINDKNKMNMELQSAGSAYVKTILESPITYSDIKLDDVEHKAITELSKIIIKVRTNVYRDPYSKEITFPAEVIEEPQRIYKQLSILYMSLKAIDKIDKTNDDNMSILIKIMLDALPIIRTKVLSAILKSGTNDIDVIANEAKLSRSYVSRIIEEMVFLDIIRLGLGTYEIVDRELYNAIKTYCL